RLGSELAVNAQPDVDTVGATVAADGNGRFIVARTRVPSPEESDVVARRYAADGSPVGIEFQVNTYATGWQRFPAVAADAVGDFVVVWEDAGTYTSYRDGSSSAVFGQRFDSSGSRVGDEFQVNTYTISAQFNPDVAM